MRVRFYGTRGSIATPGPATVKYGGNTSCVTVCSDSGTLVLLDIGTGAAKLGRELMAAGGKLRGHILIGHTHWDHIQGLPFFAPLFVPGNEWDIYAPRGMRQSLQDTLAGQMEHTYFPVQLDQLGATIRFHDLVEGRLNIGDFQVTAQYLNHPALTLGYRLEVDGASVVYACDHEPHTRALADGPGEITGDDLRHARFLTDADLVIHDSQYLASEYPTKVGWGHSTIEYAVAVSRFAKVRRLALTHHDPIRTDAALDAVLSTLGMTKEGGEMDIFVAAEGMEIELRGVARPDTATRSEALFTAPEVLVGVKVVMAVTTPGPLNTLVKALDEEDVRTVIARPEDLARLVDVEKPSLVIVEDSDDATAAARAIRATDTETPILLVTAQDTETQDTDDLFSDRLSAPFTLSYARARLRAMVMRRASLWRRAEKPNDEARRLESLRGLNVLDTPPEERFDRLTRLAAALLDAPIALISLVDDTRQWFKSSCGVEVSESPRDESFCAHAVVNRAPIIVPDALLDPRFAENPLVINLPRIRFYAGYPLFLEDGSCIGTLCVLDTIPRDASAATLDRLRDLAALASQELARPASVAFA